jgi:hypothetical protein
MGILEFWTSSEKFLLASTYTWDCVIALVIAYDFIDGGMI